MQKIQLSEYSIKKNHLDKIINENMDLPIALILKKIKQFNENCYVAPVRFMQ